MSNLTEKDEATLSFIVEFIKSHLFPPTIREICEGTGVTSSSTVYNRLRRLQEFGKLRIDEYGRISPVGYSVVENGKSDVRIREDGNQNG